MQLLAIGRLRHRSSLPLINAPPPPTAADNHRPQSEGHTFCSFCHTLHGNAFLSTEKRSSVRALAAASFSASHFGNLATFTHGLSC